MTEIDFSYQLMNLEENLSRFAIKLTSNRDDAKDLVQETMFKAIKYRDQFTKDTSLKSWTYTIMKNTFINNYRKNLRHNAAFDNTADLYFLNHTKDSLRNEPDSAYMAQELNKVIDSFGDEFRIPFKMHVEGYKYKEIAQRLDLKLGTVKSRIFFTRKKLMDTLSNLYQ